MPPPTERRGFSAGARVADGDAAIVERDGALAFELAQMRVHGLARQAGHLAELGLGD